EQWADAPTVWVGPESPFRSELSSNLILPRSLGTIYHSPVAHHGVDGVPPLEED
ncbi:hypothetical protein KUCAC02_024013, partial [Chaenocephalus aceratus]